MEPADADVTTPVADDDVLMLILKYDALDLPAAGAPGAQLEADDKEKLEEKARVYAHLLNIVPRADGSAPIAGKALASSRPYVAAALAIALPFALALQPLQMELDVFSLEPEFQALKKVDGSPLTHVYASKGM